MEELNLNQSKMESGPKFEYEIARNGDAIFVTGKSKDELVNVALEIYKKLNRSEMVMARDKEALFNEEELRPSGVFGMRIRKDSRQGKDPESYYLLVDNRNAQGQKEYQDELKKSVLESINAK